MQQNNPKQQTKPVLSENDSFPPKAEKTANNGLKHKARFLVPILALFVAAGAAYAAHTAWEKPRTASVSLHGAGQQFSQNFASVRPAQQYRLRFALTESSAANRAAEQSLLLNINKPVVKQQAVGVYVDNTFIGAVQDGSELQSMLNTFLSRAESNTGCTTASILNKIRLVPGQYDKSVIVTENAMQVLLSGEKTASKTYTVENGDTIDKIAKKSGVTAARLAAVNPGLNVKSLQPGDVIYLEPQKKLLSIQTVGSKTETSSIAYSKQTVPSASLNKGQRVLKTKGTAGTKATTYQVTYVNGVETARKIISQKTVPPVTEVTEQGTKEQPKAQTVTTSAVGMATGSFLWPVPTLTTVTSGYSARWGRFHYGLDISGENAMGQPIYAADGGTVQFSGVDPGGFGNYVVIDHGNGYCSIYGHACKLLVSQGQKVAQGQLIAMVGSTGHSTGAHCHFEVHKNGEKVNPTNLVHADVAKTVSYLGNKLTAEQITAMDKAAQQTAKLTLETYQKSISTAAATAANQ
ncbi:MULTISPECIES: peptidoglycan DD-metalloendopeptidase family protein [Caproicibacterium]|jgi:murein DD-endopeptidase MepM/ murein hydrolase activator NlpD|uniref:Peptidoglycan DD-metalloendopeptidase family protein n=1 Tax=Caproicibacterium lactatifermentans TaxID=2666138 RepID=A0A859DRN9_9FIRM|nr:M23 family metallopeptidase [Caproicibacterium lactatifermentans]ARP50118.1 hypothetical protein B6259_04030 [Ruminococcaceae bacterium CPB6]MDD4808005.1 M23 family metallopeptidase [Oscillospiraceae bacterium]QKN24159.1 peptidoglycan DD-metalloendopeptidase family protein [Caproicibacterium lactatifermentans]QKO30773.1 peptidoglycan DD-metalloendopeptidase family protein [Caproicibacterium lactatifermentans]